MPVANREFCDACSALDLSTITTVRKLIDVLDEQSKPLATDEALRIDMGRAQPDIWCDLRQLWGAVSTAHTGLSGDEDEGREDDLRTLCVSLARFTRNLVAAVPYNQQQAFENEPAMRALVHYYTSWSVLENPKSHLATRMLSQTLCNLVTANDDLMNRLWDSYLNLPQEQFILIRLFGVPDAITTTAVFVLILNCLHGSESRTAQLTNSANGPRLCISLLDRIASLFEVEESSDSTRAFDLGYRIFCRMIEASTVPEVYARIAVEDEIVSPHQTTLLKLLDSYLQPSQSRGLAADSSELRRLTEFVTRIFFTLALYTQQAIGRALGPNNARSLPESGDPRAYSLQSPSAAPSGAQALQELDLLLPKICEALVLVTQCLTSLSLISEESAGTPPRPPAPQGRPGDRATGQHLKDAISNAVAPSGEGMVECLIATLRQLDLFLPRITLGKVAPAPVPVEHARDVARELHANAAAGGGAGTTGAADPKGFAYLKRDLVRLLGILVADRRAVQDRVRVCGGLQVVMNMCVMDERNPYLREHAIFTLRNLLHGNSDNQALVNEIQPVNEWDADGMLQSRPGAAQR